MSSGYDAAGNHTGLRRRDSRTLTFDYDALNWMTSKIVPDACVTGYVYDAENRLISTTVGAALTYDALGRLYSTTGTTTGTTTFLYDGDALVAEYDRSGTLLRRYVHGNDEDDPIVWYEGATLSYPRSLQIDTQGSITSIADASGAWCCQSKANRSPHDALGSLKLAA